MSAAVALKTLRDQRRSLIGWSIGIAATVLIMAAIWPTMGDMNIEDILEQYPEALREVFNISSMSTGAGFLDAELFSLMVPAIFIVFAVGKGARLIAGEEEDGTLELLLSLPVRRSAVLWSKAAALVVSILVLGAVLFVSMVVSSPLFGLDLSVASALVGAVAMVLIGVEFGLIAIALSAISGRRAVAVGLSAGAAGASYLLYLAAELVESLRPLRNVSPFYQVTSGGPLAGPLPSIAWITVGVGFVALVCGVVVFDRRDLRL